MPSPDASPIRTETSDITELLEAWNQGDSHALDRLIPLVYDELHRLAGRLMNGERSEHTLRSTALVHEAYLRLIDYRHPSWQNRTHFFGAAANLMRRILVDYARQRQAAKRGVGVCVDTEELPGNEMLEPRLMAVDHLLDKLARLDPQQARVVELRFFGGLSNEETAEVMNVSLSAVKREWSSAKAWLYFHLKS